MSGLSTTFTSLDAVGPSIPADNTTPVRVSESSSPARARLGQRVQESFNIDFGTMIGPGWGLYGGDRGDQPFDSTNQWWIPADRVTLPNHAPSGIFAEPQFRSMITWARWLTERNYLAIGFWEAVTNFVGPMKVAFVRRDQQEVQADDGNRDPLCRDCLKVWEETCQANGWGPRLTAHDMEKESRKRLLRDSELIIRSGCGDRSRDFLPWLRHIEPEQVRQPAGPMNELTRGDWQWGICTDPHDPQTRYSMWIADPDSGGAYGEEVSFEELIFAKVNTDSSIKRGLSDYFPTESMFQDTMGLEVNMVKTSRSQAAIAWIERYATALPDMVRDIIRRQADGFINPTGTPGLGPNFGSGDYSPNQYHHHRRLPVRKNAAGTVIHADQNREYEDGPASRGIPGYAQVVDLALSGIGFRWGCPKWFSGESSSFAESLVTGSPFVCATEDRQDAVAGYTGELAMRVIRLAERSGILPHGTSRKVKPVITSKPVIIADEQKRASVDDMRLKNGTISPQEVIRKDNLDPEVVLKEIIEWKQKTGGGQGDQVGGQQTTDDPNAQPDQPAASQDPESNPPGSSGGDGFGDLVNGAVMESGPGLVLKDVVVHRDGKTFHQKRKMRIGQASPATTPTATVPRPTSAIPSHNDTLKQIATDFPELVHHPKTWDRVKKAAVAIHDVVFQAAMKLTPAVQAIAENVLDTPGDMQKLCYNPTTLGTHHAQADPMRDHIGISTHMFCGLASKIISHGFAYAKDRLKAREEGGDIAETTATWISDLLDDINRAVGVDIKVDRAAVLDAVRSHPSPARASESAPGVGLTEKEIDVHRDGKTFKEKRMVRTGDTPVGDKPTTPQEPPPKKVRSPKQPVDTDKAAHAVHTQMHQIGEQIIAGRTKMKELDQQAASVNDPAERASLAEHRSAIWAHVDSLKDDARKHLAAAMKPHLKNPASLKQFHMSIAPPGAELVGEDMHPHQAKAINDAHAFIGSVCSYKGNQYYGLVKSQDGRAFAMNRGDKSIPVVAVGSEFDGAVPSNTEGVDYNAKKNARDTTKTHIHELGHVLEYRKPGVREAAQAFLKSRIGDEKPKSLNEINGSTGYGDDEIACPDDFAKSFGRNGAYVGKVYKSGNTEIISMGLEKMYDDPISFARNDPEYFRFMVKVLAS